MTNGRINTDQTYRANHEMRITEGRPSQAEQPPEYSPAFYVIAWKDAGLAILGKPQESTVVARRTLISSLGMPHIFAQ
jgi:hypothetical protein